MYAIKVGAEENNEQEQYDTLDDCEYRFGKSTVFLAIENFNTVKIRLDVIWL